MFDAEAHPPRHYMSRSDEDPETWHTGTTGVSAGAECRAIGGLPSIKADQPGACCPAECGVCGGSGCGRIEIPNGQEPDPRGSTSVAHKCCTGRILEDAEPCGTTGHNGHRGASPPCVMAEPWCVSTPALVDYAA